MSPSLCRFISSDAMLATPPAFDADEEARQQTLKRLILELERSHRSEAQARQQAADAVAAKQLLSEASAASVAELEAALDGERRGSRTRYRTLGAQLQSVSECLHVERRVLALALREVEADAESELRLLQLELQSAGASASDEYRMRLSDASDRADELLIQARSEHAAEVATMDRQAQALHEQLAHLQLSVSNMRGESEAVQEAAAEAVHAAVRARDTDASAAAAALAASTSRAERSEGAAAALRAEVRSLEGEWLAARSTAEGARVSLRAMTASSHEYAMRMEEATDARREATEKAAQELASQLADSDKEVADLREAAQRTRRESAGELARHVGEREANELIMLRALQEEELMHHAELVVYSDAVSEARAALDESRGEVEEERERRLALEESLSARMQMLEQLLETAVESRETERAASAAAAEDAIAEARAEAIAAREGGEEGMRAAEAKLDEATSEVGAAKGAAAAATAEALATREALSEAHVQIGLLEQEAARKEQLIRELESNVAYEQANGRAEAEQARRLSGAAAVEAVGRAEELMDRAREQVAESVEAAEVAALEERARSAIERRLLAWSLAAEESVVHDVGASASAEAAADATRLTVICNELRSVERKGATARSHAARALKEVKERAAAARAAQDELVPAREAAARAEAALAAATSREAILQRHISSLEIELELSQAATAAAAASAAKAEHVKEERGLGRVTDLEEARLRWEKRRSIEEARRLDELKAEHDRHVDDREEEWAMALAAERAEHREAQRRERDRLSGVLEEEVRRRHEAEDKLAAQLDQPREPRSERRPSMSGSDEEDELAERRWRRSTSGSRRREFGVKRNSMTAAEAVAAAAKEVEEAGGCAPSALATSQVVTRAAAMAAEELANEAAERVAMLSSEAAAEREIELSIVHEAQIAQVRSELGSAKKELHDEQRLRHQAEAAAAHGAQEAMAEQTRWRAAAAEGWLAAGREAKRRQKAQLARMSEMLVASANAVAGGGVTGTPQTAHTPQTAMGGITESPSLMPPTALPTWVGGLLTDATGGEEADDDDDHWRGAEQLARRFAQHASPPPSLPPSLPPSPAPARADDHQSAIASPVGPARGHRPPSLAPRTARVNTPNTARGAASAARAPASRGPRGSLMGGAGLRPPLAQAPRVRYDPESEYA